MTGPEPSYDPETLREVYADDALVRRRISELRHDIAAAPDDVAELLARGDLIDYLRGIGELDEALEQANRAVDRAELAGTPPQQHLAALRLAHVQQWRGDFVESNLSFTELVHDARQFGPVIEAYTQQYAGLNAYDQHDYLAARDHFARALAIRREYELEDDAAFSQLALDAAQRRLQEAR